MAVEGIGVVDVTVNVNGQCASTTFEFAPPRLDQAPRHDARGYLLPTMGGTLNCDGANFGSPVSLGVSLELLWSASPAGALQPTPSVSRMILRHDHTLILLRVPPGVGRGASFAFEVDGTRTNVAEFAYEAPSLLSVSPSVVDAEGDTITLVGKNFGVTDPRLANISVTVRLGSDLCDATWIADVRV